MKRTALFALAMGLALAANAQQHRISPAAAAPTDAPLDGQDAAARAAEQEAEDREHDRNCLTQTGSRLIRRDSTGRKCAAAFGRSYTAEDLKRTGATEIAEALRLLDPSFN